VVLPTVRVAHRALRSISCSCQSSELVRGAGSDDCSSGPGAPSSYGLAIRWSSGTSPTRRTLPHRPGGVPLRTLPGRGSSRCGLAMRSAWRCSSSSTSPCGPVGQAGRAMRRRVRHTCRGGGSVRALRGALPTQCSNSQRSPFGHATPYRAVFCSAVSTSANGSGLPPATAGV